MHRLPEFQDELQKLLQTTEDSLRNLPRPPSSDALAEILHVVSEFSRDLSVQLEGTPEEGGLLQIIRPALETFRKSIRATAPRFVPRQSTAPVTITSEELTPGFLTAEEGPHVFEMDTGSDIYIDEVMATAQR